MENIELHIEALIFASEQSISLDEIQTVIEAANEGEIDRGIIEEAIKNIAAKYESGKLAIGLYFMNNGYQFLTKREFHPVINQLQIQRSKRKLSQAALETLAIIAYKQPVTKLDVEQIRGVNCDYTIQRLLEKELITISGKAETIGKPLLYSTSGLFMDYFGIGSVKELPQLKDIETTENKIGENNS